MNMVCTQSMTDYGTCPALLDCALHGYCPHVCALANHITSGQHALQLWSQPVRNMTSAVALLRCDGVQALNSTDSHSEDAEHSHSEEEEEEEELPPFLSDVEAVEIGRECLGMLSSCHLSTVETARSPPPMSDAERLWGL